MLLFHNYKIDGNKRDIKKLIDEDPHLCIAFDNEDNIISYNKLNHQFVIKKKEEIEEDLIYEKWKLFSESCLVVDKEESTNKKNIVYDEEESTDKKNNIDNSFIESTINMDYLQYNISKFYYMVLIFFRAVVPMGFCYLVGIPFFIIMFLLFLFYASFYAEIDEDVKYFSDSIDRSPFKSRYASYLVYINRFFNYYFDKSHIFPLGTIWYMLDQYNSYSNSKKLIRIP